LEVGVFGKKYVPVATPGPLLDPVPIGKSERGHVALTAGKALHFYREGTEEMAMLAREATSDFRDNVAKMYECDEPEVQAEFVEQVQFTLCVGFLVAIFEQDEGHARAGETLPRYWNALATVVERKVDPDFRATCPDCSSS
jgi:hypothetical protein